MYYDSHTHIINFDNNVQSILNYDCATINQIEANQIYSIGLHPWHVNAYSPSLIQNFSNFIQHNKCFVAIGECGLDKIKNNNNWQKQLDIFEFQVNLAVQLQLPIIIHCVKAYNECLEILNTKQAVFHNFNKKVELAQQIIKKGHMLSFGSSIIKQPEQTKDVLKNIDKSFILLETDNSNCDIKDIYLEAAKIINSNLDAFILQIEKNFKRTFYYE